jgi:hypothetical protein
MNAPKNVFAMHSCWPSAAFQAAMSSWPAENFSVISQKQLRLTLERAEEHRHQTNQKVVNEAAPAAVQEIETRIQNHS